MRIQLGGIKQAQQSYTPVSLALTITLQRQKTMRLNLKPATKLINLAIPKVYIAIMAAFQLHSRPKNCAIPKQ